MARKRKRTTQKRTPTTRRRTQPVRVARRRSSSGGSHSSMKDILLEGACMLGGAIVSSMVSRAVIRPGVPTPTDQTGDLGRAKIRALAQVGIGVAGVMFGKKSKLIASAGKGALAYGGVQALKAFMPNQTFLGEEVSGEQLQFAPGYQGENLLGATEDLSADEMNEDLSADELAEDALNDDLGYGADAL